MAAKLQDIGKIITKALQSKRVLIAAGESAVESIKLRTRLGGAVLEPESNRQPLPALQPKTKSNRKALVETTKTKTKVKKSLKERINQAKKGKFKKALESTKTKTTKTYTGNVHKAFTPSKSNLTLTGQLIDSVDFNAKSNSVEIFLNNELAKDKATWIQKIKPGFTFMNLSKAEINRMIKQMTKEVTEILNTIKFDKL